MIRISFLKTNKSSQEKFLSIIKNKSYTAIENGKFITYTIIGFEYIDEILKIKGVYLG